MMRFNVGAGRRKPAGTNATAAEAEVLFRSMTSYGGTYTIDGNEITHHVDVWRNESGNAPSRNASRASKATEFICRRRRRPIRSPAR